MTSAASSSDVSYRQTLSQALYASSILTGAHDDKLGIQRGTHSTKLGAQHQQERQDALNTTLSDRLKHSTAACAELLSFQLHSDPQVATGDLALQLLSIIHAGLIERKSDATSRVAVQDERLPGFKRKGVQPTEDVGLGVKDVKLVTTLQSLASKWALSTRIKAYDQSLFSLTPKGFPRAQDKTRSTKLTEHNRFQEIDDDEELRDRSNARAAFSAARTDLADVVERWTEILTTHDSTTGSKGTVSAATNVVTVMLRVGIVDYLSSLLRLGFGPSGQAVSSIAPAATPAPTKDTLQKRTAAATSQLLRFLSTHSAMSALSAVIAHSDANLGAPSFVKAVSSRLLSAQLLRSDGVRSLFIITFGGADLAESIELEGKGQETGTAAPGTNSLKRFEQCARLLLTPPQGMPIDVYLPIILPNLLDILAPDLSTSSTVTPPPQEQMRAAGFVLTRISERYPEQFFRSMHDRVYSKFRPSMQAAVEAPKVGSPSDSESPSAVVVSSAELESAISTLSSFMLFSEPSPTFFTTLFEPILPQLLTLYNYLHAQNRSAGKGKVRSLESGGHADRLRAEVSNFLKTWARLVDASTGAQCFVKSIEVAEKGIGYKEAATAGASPGSEQDSFFWNEESDGISIRYGSPPDQAEQDISALLKDLSLAALAKQISSGDSDELDLTKIAPDLSATLGLQPDPRLLATLLKTADRKDLARALLPLVLNTYMAIKSAGRSRVGGQDEGADTRSLLYLQLILQLLEAFGSELLQGDIPATLAFIDFSLSSPSQRQGPQQQPERSAASDEAAEDEMPFISAKSSGSQSVMPSLFHVAGDSINNPDKASGLSASTALPETDAAEDDEDEEELVSTSLSLLLSLLESDPSLSSETQAMLLVIADKIESLLDSPSSEIRSLSKEAKLVLMARRSSLRGPPPTVGPTHPTSSTSAQALAYAQAQETYQEALKLLQDPILPVRAHGLVLLRRLVSDDPKSGGQHVGRVDPALIPAILDIFLHAVQDEESYLYLNAVQGLSALASSGGGQTIARLVGIYIGRDDGLSSQGLAAREVEKRLRVGEALLQVIQRCADAMVAHVDAVVPPLLVKLRDRALPNVLRSSFISILGTVVEAAPLAMARKGFAGQLAEVCIDVVVIEMQRSGAAKRGAVKLNVQGKRVSNPDEDDEEKERQRAKEQRKLDSATDSDAKVAHLRRAAMLLLTLLVRGTRFQLEEQDGERGGRLVEKLSALRLPGGGMLPSVSAAGDGDAKQKDGLQKRDLLFPPQLLERLKQVAGYVEAGDTDAVVRMHAHDCLEHVDALSLELVQSGMLLSR